MSTSEKWTTVYMCLCGEGTILEHVDSPDNAYSRVTRTYEITCSVCAKQWIWSETRDAFLNLSPNAEAKIRKITSLQSGSLQVKPR